MFKAARNTAPSLNGLLIRAMPGGVEEVLRLIVSVADGERRVGGRVGFDGGEGDAHGDDNDNGIDDDNEGYGYAHDDGNVDGGLVRRYVMVVSVVMNHAWSEKAVILGSRGKVQASIVPRGQRGKRDVRAHKGYRK